LLFNGNPLLRFDGYYVLADAIEIPNLGTRANKYLGYLYQRYLCGVPDAENPAESPGERAWMVLYGIAAFFYRIFILFVIIVFIAGKFFFVGVLLALWAAATQVIVPLGKNLSFLATSPGLRRQRGRVMGTSLLLALAAAGLLFVAPAPSWTRAQGVVWVPEEAQVRAGTDGFIERVLAAPGAEVARGQPLIETGDPFLRTRVTLLKAQLAELSAQYDALVVEDRVQAAMVREEMASVAANLERSREREAQLVIRSPVDGRFVAPNAADLPGRFVSKGQLVAYVVQPKALTARVALGQDDIGQVRNRTRSVEVMLSGWGEDPMPARVLREVPGASRQLPTAALGAAGGGPFAVDPSDGQGATALTRVFQLELALPDEVRSAYLGARVFVRFDHGFEPVGFQIYRATRQLLLRQFDV
jgi:putative peptide zinc metalloprotease protein